MAPRVRYRQWMQIVISGMVLMLGSACGTTDKSEEMETITASHHTAEGFRNTDPGFESHSFGDFLRWVIRDRLFGDDKLERMHYPVEVAGDGVGMLADALDKPFTVSWIGHATMLIRMGGKTIMTDPVFSDRASPLSWAGPRRKAPPGIPMKALPPVDVVLISHNHYDHLDAATIRTLGNGPLYLIPLGLGAFFECQGITNFREMDWGETHTIAGVTVACLPAQHFSSRTLSDRNRTLWCSFAILNDDKRVYFGGDSGYFGGLKDVGRQWGPFDVVALPIGAYLPSWFMGPVHMGPAEALQAARDLGARHMIPIHWGVFDLADDRHDHSPAVLAGLVGDGHSLPFDVDFLKIGETRVYDE